MVRTGGERRLSDVLPQGRATAARVFTDRMWPDFGVDDLRAALDALRRRERRFGGPPRPVPTSPPPRRDPSQPLKDPA